MTGPHEQHMKGPRSVGSRLVTMACKVHSFEMVRIDGDSGNVEEATESPSTASSSETEEERRGIHNTDKVPHDHAPLRLFLPVLSLLLLLFCALVYYKQAADNALTTPLFSFLTPKPSGHLSSYSSPPMDDSVKRLYAALERATLSASQISDFPDAQQGKHSPDLSEAERISWENRHPCRSRSELKQLYRERRWTKDAVETPPHLDLVLREYEKLHRTCIRKSGNLTNLFLSRTSNGCKFVVGEAGNGVGNRILWMASTLMYAILTQRVILVDPRSLVPSLMCEPFPGSSWLTHRSFPLSDLRPDLWTGTDEFMRGIDTAKRANGTAAPTFAARGDDTWGPASRFYCTTEQQLFQEVPWLTLGGCLYFLPELFAVPAFRPTMESLFKNRIPLTHLLRYGMLPVDSLWAKVKRVREIYLRQADRLVGVHLRYRDGYADYQANNKMVNHNVLRCALENAILPNQSSSDGPAEDVQHFAPVRSGRVMVFIASLYEGLYDYLGSRYPEEATITGEVVGLVQLTREGEQLSGLDSDGRALVEVLCLSLCDALLTSPMSTYSELAQAYGGLTPWIVNFHHGPGSGCIRGQSMDGCYQGGASTYTCPYDPALDGKEVVKLVPSLKPCQDASGLQLVH